jgi:hypothetical protein
MQRHKGEAKKRDEQVFHGGMSAGRFKEMMLGWQFAVWPQTA